MGADNYYDPFVGDLQVVRFHDDRRKEQFDMGSLKIEGDMGFAQLVAAASFYERNISTMYDITTYAHYWAAQYCHDSYYTQAQLPYYWANPDTGYVVWWPVYCQGPTVDADFFQSYDTPKWAGDRKLSFEARMSSEGDTLDWLVGLYREESVDAWDAPFAGPTAGGDGSTNLYQDSISLNFWEFYFSNYYGTPVTYPGTKMHWFSQSHTDWDQTSVFGEATWHINDALDLTIGGRYFERSNTNYYLVNHPGGYPPAGSAVP
jgi:outer membrane receptor protein involved in Fe transport